MASEEKGWLCRFCGRCNPQWRESQCFGCGVSRDLAELSEDEFTRQELLALSLVIKHGGLVNADALLTIAYAMEISPERVVQALASARDKLAEDKIEQTPWKAMDLGLLGTEEDFS